MTKVGIIGCGKIADLHAEQIQRIPTSKMVSACDAEPLMARQFSERFGVRHHTHDISELLDAAHPDVVHITTPPQSHFELAKTCLNAGCSVYVEKPFTINANEAETLIRLAEEKKLKITVGHNLQFSPAALRMRKLINENYLGGPPVHMESIFCYDFGDALFARAFLGDQSHWLRSLPGKLIQNIISHGVCKIAEYLPNNNPSVIAHGHTSPLLKSIGENDIIDELRVIIHDGDSITAYFTFSSQMNPKLHQFRIHGPKNSLILDDDNQTLIQLKGGKYKSYLNHFIPPLLYSRQYLKNSLFNIYRFVKMDFHMTYGMKYLIESFHRTVSDNTPLPISYKEILLTARIMDAIFAQTNLQSSRINSESKSV